MKSVHRIGIMLALFLMLGSAVAATSTAPVLTLDIFIHSQGLFDYTYKNILGTAQTRLDSVDLRVWTRVISIKI